MEKSGSRNRPRFRRKPRLEFAAELLRKWIADNEADLAEHQKKDCVHCWVCGHLNGTIAGYRHALIALGKGEPKAKDGEAPAESA